MSCKSVTRSAVLLLALLQAAVVYGQGIATIHGIKVKESTYDPETKMVKLNFINDRAADITAYHYCINLEYIDPKMSHRECSLMDPLIEVLYFNAHSRERQAPNPNTLSDMCSMPMCNVVHPGQERIIEKHIGYQGLVNGTVVVDLVVWSDDMFEGEETQRQELVAERSGLVEIHQFASKTIKDALANGPEPDLVNAVLVTLQAEHERSPLVRTSDNANTRAIRKFAIADLAEEIRRPDRHKGSEREYVPENQRDYLSLCLRRHDYLAAEFAKHISLQKVGAN